MSRKPALDLADPRVHAAIGAFKDLCEAALNADRTVEDATVPIFWTLRSRKPEQTGTAIVLRIEDQTFLLTAAHVLEPVQHYVVLVGLGDGSPLAALSGDRFSTAPGPSGTHEDDPNDAAVLHIRSEIPQQLSRIALSLRHLDLAPPATADDIFLVAGFRSKQTRTMGSAARSRRECFPSVEYDAGTYRELDLSRERNLALAWEDQVLVGGVWQESPRPRGMSGGAIVRVANLSRSRGIPERTNPAPLLAATVSAQRRGSAGKPGVLVGSRIGLHLGLINKYLPELELKTRIAQHT
jgi:hypothetical protein